MRMVRLRGELRVLVTALIFSLALSLGFGSAAVAALPDTTVGLHGMASVDHASSPHDACMQDSCSDRIADCRSSAAHCGSAGCTALVAPAAAPGFADSVRRTWAFTRAQCLHGIDPLVNRHPPRDLG